MLKPVRLISLIAAMCAVVVLSNFLVQFPVNQTIGTLNLADLLTWAAFTYPIAFLITDLSNRLYGPAFARKIVLAGFMLAVGLSIYLATPRIAIASGTAFLLAQLLDISVFNKLRNGIWWRAPLVSSLLGSALDTTLFFTLAFAPGFAMLGVNDPFAIATAPFLGLLGAEAPRWVSWAVGDFSVKILVGIAMLAPYGIFAHLLSKGPSDKPA
ncbi:MAG: VUT family protein [Rhizobiaceae bacterium]|nr:VUT family protein [Rhizobiaceae bacterium]